MAMTASSNAIPVEKTPAQAHADRLHRIAEDLATLNSRVESFIDRLTGPSPSGVEAKAEMPSPSGALMVAEFGATRISNGLDRLRDLASRLENIA